MKLLCHIENRIEILPTFIDYYKNKGIDRFVFGLWRGKKNQHWDNIDKILENSNVDYVLEESFDFDVYCGIQDSYYQNFVREKHIDPDEWYVICDLDEFQEIGEYNSYDSLLVDLKKENCSHVSGWLVDRVTKDGSIPDKLTENIFEQFPICHRITELICQATCQKSIMQLGKYTIESGHHHCLNGSIPFSKKFIVYHFKWFGNILETLCQRHKNYKELGVKWYDEPNKAYTHIMNNHGKIKITEDLLYKI